jgi:RsmE family RNA methyltransferase
VNLLLLLDDDFLADGRVRLTGRRARHAFEVLQSSPGQRLRVGKLGGLTGEAEILEQDATSIVLRPELTVPPPPRPRVDVLLAIPRPKALKKVLPALASLGADQVVLVNAARVEKSYFDSKVLEPTFVRDLFHAGLEQARDTRAPLLSLERRFKPFIEDTLDGLFPRHRRLLAHPSPSDTPLARPAATEPILWAIGPEGGWVPFEVELLQAHGFTPVSLGPRTLRVETVVPYLFGVLGR